MLDERKLQVLYAIIDSYIHTGEPIGSRTIAKKYDLGVSPATVRNEMSDLEEMGYLGKPHTSAGRIPSDKAYRHYVDHFLSQNLLSAMHFHRVLTQDPDVTGDDIKTLLELATSLLVQWTHYTSVGVYGTEEDDILERVHLVPVEDGFLLLALLYTGQQWFNRLIHWEGHEDDHTLLSLQERINTALQAGRETAARQRALAFLLEEGPIGKTLYDLLMRSLTHSNSKIVTDGISNIYNYPEFQDAEKAKDFLLFFEDTAALAQLFPTGDEPLVIRIGSENKEERLKDTSVISARYETGGRVGRIALIGPTRMNYSRAMRAIYLITNNLQQMRPGDGTGSEER